MKHKPIALALSCALALIASGCTSIPGMEAPKPRPTLMGDAAPVNDAANLGTQIVGDWAVVLPQMDPNLARQLGTESLQTEPADADIDEIYTFKSDGTFSYGKWDGDWKVHGKWAVSGQYVDLVYEMYNDKTLQQLGEEKQKEGQVGSQAGVLGDLMYDQLMATLASRPAIKVGSDNKTLQFHKGGESDMFSMGESLARLKPMK